MIFGLDIGGTKCAVLKAEAIPENGTIPEYDRVGFPTTTRDETLERIFKAIEEFGPGDSPLFGISCGDPQDPVRGIILEPPNLPGWNDVRIGDMLTERFGGKAYLMNDANAGALAEWKFGAAVGCKNVIFMTHGTGMGAGLIIDGRLYEGTTFSAGEVGHTRVAEEGPAGYGKEGSFEGWVSGGGIARLAKARAVEFGGGAAFTPNGNIDAVSAKTVAEAAQAGDTEARKILAMSGKYLGKGLAVVIDILNPEIIVLGSLFGRIGEFLEPAMRRELEAECLPWALAACRIVPARLGERIGDLAAFSVAIYRDSHPLQ